MKDNPVDDPQKEIQALGERLRKESGVEVPTESSPETDQILKETTLGSKSTLSLGTPGNSTPGKTDVPALLSRLGTWVNGVSQASQEWARSVRTSPDKGGSESSTLSTAVTTPRGATAPKNPLGVKVTKKIVVMSGSASLVAMVAIVGLVNFAFVTVNEGIETTLGSSENRTVFVLKADDAERNDLVVAVLKRASANGDDLLILGTVFSKNDQTYALYDGEVIWQIPLGDIRGKALFASATQAP
jgi:hypothetical protein